MKIYQTFLFIQKIWDSPNTIYYFFRGYDGHILSEVESYIWSNDLSINLFQTLGDPRIGAMFL